MSFHVSLVVGAGLLMLLWSWRKWPDLFIDFGRELYIAWRLTSGERLYVDLAYLNGPLSPYLNALWFQLFGMSLQTLALCNLAILVAIVVLLERLLRIVSNKQAATVALLTFILLFAFAQLARTGNYNYLCPYSHEMTHGLGLSLLALLGFWRYLQTQRLRLLSGVGLLLGLTFLTKAEICFAIALALVVGLGLTMWAESVSARQALQRIGVVLGAATLPPLLAFLLLSRLMPAAEALRATCGTWPHILTRAAATLPFYQYWMGTTSIAESLHRLVSWSWWYLLLFGPALLCSLRLRNAEARQRQLVRLAFVAGIVIWLGLRSQHIEWGDAARPFPLIVLGLWAWIFVQFVRHRREPQRHHLLLALCLLTFALGLLAKMALYTRIYNYGFVLAMPAMLLIVVALVEWVPAWLHRRGAEAELFRMVALAAWLMWLTVHLQMVQGLFARKVSRIGSGADAFWSDARAQAASLMLEEMQRRIQPEETVVVLPQGAILNYLARRINPTPYTVVDPLILHVFGGEEGILRAFQAHPPDYFVIVHLAMWEHGFRAFGIDFGMRLTSWIRQRYHEVRVIGANPLQTDQFGLLLLERTEDDVI